MSGTPRPVTPTFRFGAPESHDAAFTFVGGRVVESSPPSRPSSGYSGQHLSPLARPGHRMAPRARSASPNYRFGDSLNQPFTFTNGCFESSPSTFDKIGELRNALPTIEPLAPVESNHPPRPFSAYSGQLSPFARLSPGTALGVGSTSLRHRSGNSEGHPSTSAGSRAESSSVFGHMGELRDALPAVEPLALAENKPPRPSSGYSGQHLSPLAKPGPSAEPRAKSASPHYRFGDSSDHPFTFGDGWVETSQSAFDRVGELRDVLPTIEPLAPLPGVPPTGHQDLVLSIEVDDDGPEGPGSDLGQSEDGLEDGDCNDDQQSPIDCETLLLSSEVDGGGPKYKLADSENGIEDGDNEFAADDDTEPEQPNYQLTHSEDGFEDGFENEDNSFTADDFDHQRPMGHQVHLSSIEVEDGETEHPGYQELFETGLELEVTRSENVFDDEDTAVDNFGQQTPNDFSLRVLHNVTPLPSRDPSPQPAETSALFLHPHPRNRTSDVSTISDLEDKAAPYDVREEGAPAHRFFTPGFQSALQEGIAIARDVWVEVEKLDDLIEGDEDLEKLVDDAAELWAFEGSDTKTIAILGDSGHGKSSLINSMLHFPGIAETGDRGTACTSVVTEYRQKTRNHTAPITIEVQHLSPSEIEVVVGELLWNYRQPYLPGVEDDAYADDRPQHQRESKQAWYALEAAFGHQPSFGEEMLKDMSEGALGRVTAQLIEWSRENEWPEGVEDGLWRSTADSANECVEKTAVFMQDRYWPFTKLIRIYLNAQVLKTGVVLADLPGLQDTNLARVRATHDYLLKCNHIFIVKNISRAITDESLQSSLFSVLSRHAPLEWDESGAQSLKVAVVCTKAEEIDLEGARRAFCGPGKPIPASEMEGLDAQIDDAKASGNRKLKKTLRNRRDLTLMKARNEHVTVGLQKAYNAKAPNGHLDVFCVSNTWYAKYSRKGNAELVRGSGIPELRKFCYGITADAQLREARHFLMGRVFGLVNSVELWVGGRLREIQGSKKSDGGQNGLGGGDSTDGGILKVVQGVTGVFHAAIHRLADKFRSCFAEQILDMIDNRHPEWETAAHTEAKEWGTWHWQTYDAWCRNNGAYSTRNRASTDWNAKIVWKLRAELDFQWDIVEEEIGTVFDELRATIAEQFGALKTAVVSASSSTPDELRAQVLAGIEARVGGCQYGVTRAQERFARDVKLLRRYVSEACHGSYILDAMVPTYRAASTQHGTGKKARQTAIVEGRITDGVLFPSAAVVLQERVEAILTNAKDTLTGVLSQGFRDVAADVGFLLASRQEVSSGDSAGVGKEEREKLEEVLERVKGLKTRAEGLRREAAASAE